MNEIINIISAWWMEAMLFLLLAVATIDLIYLVVKMKPIPRSKSTSGLFYIVVIFSFVNAGYLQGNNFSFLTDEATEEVYLAGQAEGHSSGYIYEWLKLDKVTPRMIALNSGVKCYKTHMAKKLFHCDKSSLVQNDLSVCKNHRVLTACK